MLASSQSSATLSLPTNTSFSYSSLQTGLFRSISRIAGGLGLTEIAGQWSLKALEITSHGAIDEVYVAKISQKHGVPLHLAYKVIWIESRGRHFDDDGHILTSSKGALGIMQLMPRTARELGIDPLNAQANIEGGLRYLARLSRKYHGNWDKAIAAYNWGQGHLDRAVAQYGDRWASALPDESADYLWQTH
jgi:soluble lytic murein transglycosylase-like protein